MATKNKMSSEAWAKVKESQKEKGGVKWIPVKKGKANTRRKRREEEREARKSK